MRKLTFSQRTVKQHSPIPKRMGAVLFIVLIFGSCKTLHPTQQELTVFEIWNKVPYPHKELVNGNISRSLQDVLTGEEISTVENWWNSTSRLESFLQTECVGCTNKIEVLKPIYKVEKGRFVHFGLQNEMGVENLVFKKNGAFVTHFYSFQGESKEEIHEALKNIQSIDYVLESVYPAEINTNQILLEHVEHNYQNENNGSWYQTVYPTKIAYAIDLRKSNPEVKFKFNGGLYSHQKPNEKGEHQIVNFVETFFYANAVDFDEPLTYTSFMDAFYANANFFLFSLEEEAEIAIRIESKESGKHYRFSVFRNDGFQTIQKHLNKKGKLFDQYQNKLKKGQYLIRILHENADYMENPLYTVYIDKKTMD